MWKACHNRCSIETARRHTKSQNSINDTCHLHRSRHLANTYRFHKSKQTQQCIVYWYLLSQILWAIQRHQWNYSSYQRQHTNEGINKKCGNLWYCRWCDSASKCERHLCCDYPKHLSDKHDLILFSSRLFGIYDLTFKGFWHQLWVALNRIWVDLSLVELFFVVFRLWWLYHILNTIIL